MTGLLQGIGSRLMIRQGYVMGQGLGRNQEGRAEPVPIQLLPVGAYNAIDVYMYTRYHQQPGNPLKSVAVDEKQ